MSDATNTSSADRVVAALAGAFDLYSVFLGEALGLYQALVDAGPTSSAELSIRTGVLERYAREWLEQQAVAGLLTCTDPAAPPDERRFTMPDETAAILADPEASNFIAPLARQAVYAAQSLPDMVAVYRGERTHGWEDHGQRMRQAQADATRPAYLGLLGSTWFPAIPDVHARLLDSGTPARVADVGCGEGWSSIAIGQRYPSVNVDGYDIDAGSVNAARENATTVGVEDRVRFHVEDLSDASISGRYDLVCAFECIHDMSDPVEALRAMRRLRAPNGTVIVADERCSEEFDADAGELERIIYGFSLTVCLPDGLSRQPSAGTGAAMRPSTLLEYARDAGFDTVETLDVPHDSWRFYRLE